MCVEGYSFVPVMYICVLRGIVSSLSCIYMCWGYSFVPVMYMCVGGIVSPLSCIYVLGV